MPWLPFGLRDKFTAKFNDLCDKHDADYLDGTCKLCADWEFVKAIYGRGHVVLAFIVFMAVNLPQVWLLYFINRAVK
jgi:hypothetical protein